MALRFSCSSRNENEDASVSFFVLSLSSSSLEASHEARDEEGEVKEKGEMN